MENIAWEATKQNLRRLALDDRTTYISIEERREEDDALMLIP